MEEERWPTQEELEAEFDLHFEEKELEDARQAQEEEDLQKQVWGLQYDLRRTTAERDQARLMARSLWQTATPEVRLAVYESDPPVQLPDWLRS